jgi:type IV pilus assembly protein PilA
MKSGSDKSHCRDLGAIYCHKRGRSDLESAEAGFTLIELMVVLLIMAILLAIAIPTFLGVKSGAQDRSIQSDLTNAMTSAEAGYASGGSFVTAASEVVSLSSYEPNISFETGVAAEGGTHPNNLSVNTSSDGQQLLLVGYSQSGTCWAVEDNEGDTTGNISGTPSALGVQYTHWNEGSGATCTAGTGFPTTETWAVHY